MAARKKATKATPKKRRTWKDKFLIALAESPNVSAAAAAAGHNRQHVYKARQEDAEFAAAWDDAIEQSVDMAEGEAYRRAVKGTTKPVFGPLGPKMGSGEIGQIQEYSDTLMIFLLKAHRPHKYRENIHVDISTVDSEIERELARLAGRGQAENAGASQADAGTGGKPTPSGE